MLYASLFLRKSILKPCLVHVEFTMTRLTCLSIIVNSICACIFKLSVSRQLFYLLTTLAAESILTSLKNVQVRITKNYYVLMHILLAVGRFIISTLLSLRVFTSIIQTKFYSIKLFYLYAIE